MFKNNPKFTTQNEESMNVWFMGCIGRWGNSSGNFDIRIRCIYTGKHRHAIYLVGSLFNFQPTSETYKIAFWMRKYSSLSWKRTWVWSSTPLIRALDLGPLTEQERFTSRPTTTRYKDAKGKTRFKGNTNLKRSQYLDCIS